MIVPIHKPRITTDELRRVLSRVDANLDGLLGAYKLLVIGIRGYYRDSMGAPGTNDRSIYDDAICLVTESVLASFNGNTDPSGYRKGHGTGTSKGVAVLKPGIWNAYRFDLHRGQYLALCQRAAAVTVIRDGDPPYEDTGYHGINIHRGGTNTTSSLGCQTIPPAQWDAFITLAQSEARRLFGSSWRRTTLPYILLA